MKTHLGYFYNYTTVEGLSLLIVGYVHKVQQLVKCLSKSRVIT